MRVEEYTFESYDQLLNDLKPRHAMYQLKNDCIYRGQAIDWKLIPLALREEQRQKMSDILMLDPDEFINEDDYEATKEIYFKLSDTENMCRQLEYTYLKFFYKYSNDTGLRLPKTNFKSKDYTENQDFQIMRELASSEWIKTDLAELAALAQHYGIPTRLLDWTFDIYVALYFASFNAVKMITTSEIKKIEDKSIDTKHIVIWLLERDILEKETVKYPNDAPPVKFVIPQYSDNPNIYAQKGILSYWETPQINDSSPLCKVCRTPFDEQLKNFAYDKLDNVVILHKFKIPIKESLTILKHVSSLGYNAATMFPGYYGVKQKIDESIMMKHAETIFAKMSKSVLPK